MTAREHPETELAPGDLIAERYRLVRVVGEGGMGVVWEAVNPWMDRRVAVKFLSRATKAGARATASGEHVDRFMREARATARVRHPNVVQVLDMGDDLDRGGLFIVYEFVDGASLRGVLSREGTLSPEAASALLIPVMKGVAEAHRAGVIHRDLKPENILLANEADGAAPRVIDFGIARLPPSDDDVALTVEGAAMGTAHYMSPEQCRGDADLDARTDVWSLGVIWFEALSGRVPFDGASYHAILATILTHQRPSLRALRPALPDALVDAVERSLHPDRAQRFATVSDFLDALSAPAAPAAQPLPLAPRRRPRPALLALGLAALLGLAWRASRPSAPPPSSPVTVVRAADTLPSAAPLPLPTAVVSAPPDAARAATDPLPAPPRPLQRPPPRPPPRLPEHPSHPPREPNGAPVLEL